MVTKYKKIKILTKFIGKLDCLRDSVGPKGEKPAARAKRIAANWDSDCSFEANNPSKINNFFFNSQIHNIISGQK